MIERAIAGDLEICCVIIAQQFKPQFFVASDPPDALTRKRADLTAWRTWATVRPVSLGKFVCLHFQIFQMTRADTPVAPGVGPFNLKCPNISNQPFDHEAHPVVAFANVAGVEVMTPLIFPSRFESPALDPSRDEGLDTLSPTRPQNRILDRVRGGYHVRQQSHPDPRTIPTVSAALWLGLPRPAGRAPAPSRRERAPA